MLSAAIEVLPLHSVFVGADIKTIECLQRVMEVKPHEMMEVPSFGTMEPELKGTENLSGVLPATASVERAKGKYFPSIL